MFTADLIAHSSTLLPLLRRQSRGDNIKLPLEAVAKITNLRLGVRRFRFKKFVGSKRNGFCTRAVGSFSLVSHQFSRFPFGPIFFPVDYEEKIWRGGGTPVGRV
jgi:hypothetical protein